MQIGINLFSLFFFYNLQSLSEASQSEWRVLFDFLCGIPVVPCKWQWLIQGRGPGALALPLLLDQTEAPRAENNFWETVPPLSKGLYDPPPPPYLKVWIRHSIVSSLDPNRPLLLIMGKWGNESLHRLSLVSKGTIATVKPADRDYSLRKHPFLLEERGETDVFAGYRDYREWWS